MTPATETPGVDPVALEAEKRYKPNPADVQKLAPNRDERLFLVLSIFIGVISGLLVVSFRMAIDWLSVLMRGSSPQPHQLRLIVVPTIAGLVSEIAGRIPKKGEVIEDEGLKFEVLDSTDRRVERVRITTAEPKQLKLI